MQTTELEIKIPKNGTSRAYIEFYIGSDRKREYTGRSILLNHLEPNKAKTPERRFELLLELKLALAKHIKEGNYPAVKIEEKPITHIKTYTVKEVLDLALTTKLKMNLSNRYKNDLEEVHQQFTTFLQQPELEAKFEDLQVIKLEEFLNTFNSSGTYYMKKRSDLSILFSAGAKLIGCRSKARDTHTERAKAKLHKAYDKTKMRKLLNYLSEVSPDLHLCCLLTYGCWLRPHVEALSLTKEHFKNECTEIHLSGVENKGGKVRIVYIPEYVSMHIKPIIASIEPEMNIFSRRVGVLNEFYFTTKWKRLRQALLAKKLIEDGQTIYSFRHTAAIEIYKRTKDIYLLQRMMGHGSIGVTQKYLRSLGVVNIEELKNYAPTL
jgi:integrase